jgi:hypothetical protein
MNRKKNQEPATKKMFKDTVPVIGALCLVIASAAYILFRSWNNKVYYEKWKEYEDCGI